VSGSKMIAARLSPGAISESSSSHLPPSEASKMAKPVAFPLGRSSRATILLATGSPITKTIGIVRVSRWTAAVAGVPFVRMMSGYKANDRGRRSALIKRVDDVLARPKCYRLIWREVPFVKD
jgi:hypothetical protein